MLQHVGHGGTWFPVSYCFLMSSPEPNLSTDTALLRVQHGSEIPSQSEDCQSMLCSAHSLWVQGCSWDIRAAGEMGTSLSVIPSKYTAGHISSHQLHCATLGRGAVREGSFAPPLEDE